MPSSFARFSHIFDDGLVFCVGAHQWRIGLGFLEIAGDRHGFTDLSTVVEFQHRDHRVRVSLLEPGGKRQVF
jgi:hypothetical protein